MRKLAALAGIFLAMTTAATLHAEQADNPDYAVWAKFKVGSSKTLSGTIQMGSARIEVQTTYTLREVTPSHVVVESRTTTDFGNGPHVGKPVRQVEAAKVEAEEIRNLGHENTEAMGRSFSCTVYQMKDDAVNGVERPWGGKAKVWVCPEVPGGVVKWDVNPQYATSSDNGVHIEYTLSNCVVK
jgi:hypothetical protein